MESVRDQSGPTEPAPHRPFGPLAAWCFASAGLVLIATVVLIDAHAGLLRARYERDRALAVEATHVERLDRHRSMLAALRAGDETATRAMRVHHYGVLSTVERPLPGTRPSPDLVLGSSLEPPPPVLPVEPDLDSTLARLATGQGTRLWVVLIGAVALLIGLMPAGSPGDAHRTVSARQR